MKTKIYAWLLLICLLGTSLSACGKPYEIRTPLIPGITDTEDNLSAIEAIVGGAPWEKLPYNALAGAKYAGLGMVFPLDQN